MAPGAENRNLADAVGASGPLPVDELRRIGIGLAHRLAEMHARGGVHGGLAPGAVVVTASGVDIVGTGSLTDAAGFVAPEIAAGAPADPAADVFALGAVLVYAARGSGPFGAGSPAQLLNRALTDTPSADAVPDELRPVVLSCLSPAPEQRPSAAEIAARLAPPAPSPKLLVLDKSPARPDIPPAAARPRSVIPLCAAASVLILVAALTFVVTRDSHTPAPTAQPTATATATEPARAIELAPVFAMAFSPDGRHAYAGHQDGTVSVIDTAENSVSARIGAVAGIVHGLAVSTDGARLYAESLTHFSTIDTTTRTVVDTVVLDVDTTAGDIAAPRDGRRIYIADSFLPKVSVFDTATRKVIRSTPLSHRIEFENTSTAMLTSDDKRLLVFAYFYMAGEIVILDTATDAITGRIPYTASEVSLASGSDPRHVYGVSGYGKVHAFDTIAGVGTVIADLSLPTSDLAVSPSGQYLFVAHDSSSSDQRGRISVIDRSGAVLGRLDIAFHAGSLAVAPDGRRLYVASDDYGDSNGTGWFTAVDISRYN